MKPTGRASIAPPPPPPWPGLDGGPEPKPPPPAVRTLATGITVRPPALTASPKHSRAPVSRASSLTAGGSAALAGLAHHQSS